MGASRKLQGEIDRVLKMVQEGVDVFDSIWNKVYDTDNANQKEKFEADLKKEIKKLQRYRDQIKTWIQSTEIKDKKVSASYEQALLDARKLIEREMERFKICEKEAKTKAFSKEGLGQQPKTDPKEKAKSETRGWLNNVVGELESQIDNFEAEVEGLFIKKGKTRAPRLIHLETSIVRHKAHVMKLELILRLLDNDELSPEQVNDVRDFLEDYVERNQDDFDEFSDVDELYISLPLDKVESLEDLVGIGPPALVKVAKESADVIIMNDSFSTIVIVAKWGRSVYVNIQKIVQFQLTVNVVALIVTFSSACLTGNAPLTPVQLLWVNMIMDTLGALALATEPPKDELMKRQPVGRKENFISNVMWRNILGQSFYQFIVIWYLQTEGKGKFQLAGPDSDLILNTLIFNSFVFCQVFNEISCREMEKINVFEGMLKNSVFVEVLTCIVVFQVIIIEFLGNFAKTTPLTLTQWFSSVLIGFLGMPIAAAIKMIPVG